MVMDCLATHKQGVQVMHARLVPTSRPWQRPLLRPRCKFMTMPTMSATSSRSSLAGGELTSIQPATQEKEVAQDVPATLPGALRVFMATPTAMFATTMISGCAGWRLKLASEGLAPLSLLDASVFLLACATWIIQEWAIHKYLLHSTTDWLGSRIHVGHHTRPYHQVVVDGLEIVAPFMILTAGIFWAMLKDWGISTVLSTCVGYHLTGLLSYQLVHYLVHTKWVPNNQYMRDVRRNHMLHHLRSHDHWFAFSAPQMDWVMGTAPAHPSDVPLKTMVATGRKSSSLPAAHTSEHLASDTRVVAAQHVSADAS